MTAPGIVILLFGLLVLGGGIIGYTNTASVASLMGGIASGFGLLASGLGVLRRKELGFVFAPFITVLLMAFFAYRLAVSGDFIPSGLMGILGLVALVLYCALPAKEN
ncbi:MAG: putative rane protein [Deltaproteobacteria bacterium]|nr:putative rane protein [Deltaproteobacteria bacterium]